MAIILHIRFILRSYYNEVRGFEINGLQFLLKVFRIVRK